MEGISVEAKKFRSVSEIEVKIKKVTLGELVAEDEGCEERSGIVTSIRSQFFTRRV